MNGIPSNDMEGLVSAVDMGFSSVTSILSDIYSQGEDTKKAVGSILDRIDSFFNKFTAQFDSTVGTVFGTLSGAFRNYQKLNYQTNLSILKTMKSNNSLLTKLIEAITKKGNLSIFDLQEKKKNKKYQDPVKQSTGIGGKIINANNIYEFYLKDSNRKTLDSFTNGIKELNKFAKVDGRKLTDIVKFTKDLYTNLNLLNNILKPVAIGFTLLSGSLILFNYVSLINIFKLAMVFPILGAGIGMFIYAIISSTKGVGSGLMGAFKVWLLMKQLPDIFISLGKGTLMLSVALILFNAVGYESMLKLIATMIGLGVAFNLMSGEETNWSGTTRLFIIVGLLLAITHALIQTANIKWDSVMKLPAFIAGLGLSLKIGGFYGNNKLRVMNVIGISLLLITLSLLQFNDISWEQVIKFNFFIAGLGLALRTISKDMSIMGVIALGMIMLTAAMLDFQELNILSIVQIIGVVGLLGVVINKFVLGKSGIGNTMKNVGNWSDLGGHGSTGIGLIGFAFGLAFLAGAVYLFSNVSWSAVGRAIAMIATLGLVIKIFFNDRTTSMFGFKDKRSFSVPSMIGFGLGMGLLVLALDAVSEIQWTSVFQLIAMIVGIGVAFRIMGPNTKVSGMLGYALGMGILVLAVDAMSEVKWESVFKMVTFVVGMGAAMWLMKGAGFWQMLAFAGVVTVLYFTIKNIMTLKLDETKFQIRLLIFGLSVAALTGIMFLLGKIASKIAPGILAAGGIGLVTWLMVKALTNMSSISDDWQDYVNFLIGVGIATAVVAIIGALMLIPGAQIVLGAGLIAVAGIALVTYLMGHALNAISGLSYNEKAFEQYAFGIKKVIGAFIDLDPIATLASAVTAVATLPILLVSLVAIGILKLISIVDIDLPKIGKFTQGLGYLIKSYNDNISGWKLTKSVLKSVALLPFLGMMFLATLTMGKISSTEIKPNQIGAFTSMLGLFVKESLQVLADNESGMRKAQPGIKALSKLMNIAGNLAKSVQDIANLRFYEYEVRDGKLVLSGQRSLNQNDFDNVGKSIGKLILALINPLQVLGSNSDVWRIGSDTIRNPFKNDLLLNGIENVKKISEVFKPLVDTVKSYASMKIAQDYGATNRFVFSLQETAKAYAYVFWKLSTIKTNESKNAIRKIADLNDVFEDFDNDSITSLDKMFIRFIDNLSDSNKWKRIHINTGVLVKNLQRAAKAINSINLEKAAALEVNVKQLGDRKISDNIVQAVEAFTELFGYITLSQQQQLSMMSNISTNTGQMVTGLQTWGSNVLTPQEQQQQNNTGATFQIQNTINDKKNLELTDSQKANLGFDMNLIDKNHDGNIGFEELIDIQKHNASLLQKLIQVLSTK